MCLNAFKHFLVNTSSGVENTFFMIYISEGSQVQPIESMCHNL